MGLKIPNLDQKEFAQMMEESLARLPSYTEKWTDHNASDPGITIMELLAWMADINSYRLNRIGTEHYLGFLELLEGKVQSESKNEVDVESLNSVKKALLAFSKNLNTPSKAVSLEDFEYLALSTPKTNLAKAKATVNKALNEVSVVVVPHGEKASQPGCLTRTKVQKYLEEKRLLTTRVKIVEEVTYTPINVHLKLLTKYRDPSALKEKVLLLLDRFLHPLYGGKKSEGWEFGEDVHVAHIYQLLHTIEGIDRIDSVYLSAYKNTNTEIFIDQNALPTFGDKHQVDVKSMITLGSCP